MSEPTYMGRTFAEWEAECERLREFEAHSYEQMVENDRLRNENEGLQLACEVVGEERDRLLKEKNAALGAFHKDCRKERDRLRKALRDVEANTCSACENNYIASLALEGTSDE